MKQIIPILIIILIITLIVGIVSINKGCQTCKMYNELWNRTKYEIYGFHVPSDYKTYNTEYYCIWVKGRTSKQIATTKQEEICHALVDKQPLHFCKNKKI